MQLRPRSMPELIDASVQLARRHYVPLLLVAAVVAIPGLVIGLVNAWLVPTTDAQQVPLTALLTVLPLTLAGMACTCVGVGALVATAAAAYTAGVTLPADSAIRQGLARAGALIGGLFLAYLRATLGALLVMVPLVVVAGMLTLALGRNPIVSGLAFVAAFVASLGWFLAIAARYASVPSIIMLEGRGAMESLRRSRALAEGSVKRIAGVLALVFGLLTILWLTLFVLAATVAGSQPLASALVSVVAIPVYPVFACVLVLLYYDLRIRKEGYDLELMARELGDAPARADGTAGQPSF
jgi:hypothetical protein